MVIVASEVDWQVSVAETSTNLNGQEPQIVHMKLPKAHRRGRTVDAGEIVAPTECFRVQFMLIFNIFSLNITPYSSSTVWWCAKLDQKCRIIYDTSDIVSRRQTLYILQLVPRYVRCRLSFLIFCSTSERWSSANHGDLA
jgi:hypothetical protein